MTNLLTHFCSHIAKSFHLFQAEYEKMISLQLILKTVSLNWNQSMLLSCARQKTEAEVGKLITDKIRQIILLGEEKWVRIRNWQAVGQFLFFSSLASESPVSAGELEYFRLTWMKRMIQPTDLQQLVSYSLAGKRLGIFRQAAAGEIRVRRSDTIRYGYKDLKFSMESNVRSWMYVWRLSSWK